MRRRDRVRNESSRFGGNSGSNCQITDGAFKHDTAAAASGCLTADDTSSGRSAILASGADNKRPSNYK